VDRCALFVDAGYVLADGAMAVHGTRRRESVSWDYAGLLQFLAGLAAQRSGLPLLRCYWYEATVEGRRGADHDALADLPGVKLRLAKMRPGRREGVESEIHRDLATLARNKAVSDAMVVSAEEDLASVIADVQDLGMRVTMLHITSDGNWTISRSLRQECDDIVEISASELRPYVDLISGAEPAGADDQDSGPRELARPGTNGHSPAGAGAFPGSEAFASTAGLAGPGGPANGLAAVAAGPPGDGRLLPSFTPAPGAGGNGYHPGRDELPAAAAQGHLPQGQAAPGPVSLGGPMAPGEVSWPDVPPVPPLPSPYDDASRVPDPQLMYSGPQPAVPAAPPAMPAGPAMPDYMAPSGAVPAGRPDLPPARQVLHPMGAGAPTGVPSGGQPQLPSAQPQEAQDAPGAVGLPGLPAPVEIFSSHELYPAPVAAQMPPAVQFTPGLPGGFGAPGALQDLSGYSPGAPREQAGRDAAELAYRPGDEAPYGQVARPELVPVEAGAQVRRLPARGPAGAIPPAPPVAATAGPPMGAPQGQPGPQPPAQPLPAGSGAPAGYGPGIPQAYSGPQSAPASGPQSAPPSGLQSGGPQSGGLQSGGLQSGGLQSGGSQLGGPPSAGAGSQPGAAALPPGLGVAPGALDSMSGMTGLGQAPAAPGTQPGPLGAVPAGAGPLPGVPALGPMPSAPPAPGTMPPPGGPVPANGLAPLNGLPQAGGSVPVTGLPEAPALGPGLAPSYAAASSQPAISLADAVQSAHEEGQEFGNSVARDAPALWLEAVLARKPRMPSDLEARLLQGSSLPIDFLLHDEVRHALRRGFWEALERARR
jgi:uncharacterized LabA/DUF88 family protein